MIMKRVLLCVWVISGCVGTDVGNPQTDSDVELTFSVETHTESQVQALQQQGIELAKATMILESVELRKECSGEEGIITTGPFVIDLLEETTIKLQNAGPGTYCRASFHFADRIKTITPWLVLEGTLPDGTVFSVEGKRGEVLTLNGNADLILDDDGTSLNLSFDVFDTLSDLEGSDTPLLISEDSNIPAYNAIRQNLRTSVLLYKDSNRNRVVEADEKTPVGLPLP